MAKQWYKATNGMTLHLHNPTRELSQEDVDEVAAMLTDYLRQRKEEEFQRTSAPSHKDCNA